MVDHLVERLRPAVVEVRRRVLDVPQRRNLELTEPADREPSEVPGDRRATRIRRHRNSTAPSGLVNWYARNGSPFGSSSPLRIDWNRSPAGTKYGGTGIGLNPLLVLSIGPLWQIAQMPRVDGGVSGTSSKNARPRFSDAVLPAGSCGGGPPSAHSRSALT